MKSEVLSILNRLSYAINQEYGFCEEMGDCFNEPAINLGPCGPFANAFYHCWNRRFNDAAHIVFVMVKNTNECWHVVIRLPNGFLFDGGIGIHEDSHYNKDKFSIEDMVQYDLTLLDERSYGLNRKYPRYCPRFDLGSITQIIEMHLAEIHKLCLLTEKLHKS
jgi:hypothetical protein